MARNLPRVQLPPMEGARPNPEWLREGMVALFDARSATELISGQQASNITSLMEVSAQLGWGADLSGTANQQYAARPEWGVTAALTIIACIEVDALTNYGAIISKWDGSTFGASIPANVPYEMRVGSGATSGDTYLFHSNGANYTYFYSASPAPVTAGLSGVVAMSRSSGAAGFFGNVGSVYSRGGIVSPMTYFDNAGYSGPAGNAGDVWIGRRYDGATQLDGRIFWVAVFAREVASAFTMRAVSRPALAFAPLRKRSRVSAPASGAYTLTADPGSYTLTGTDVALTAARTLAIDTGSYALTGNDVALLKGYALAADTGSYSLTGTDVALTAARVLVPDAGSYSLSGVDVGLAAARVLAADTGAYVLTGQDVTLTYTPAGSYTLTVEAGSYSITGQAVDLKAARSIAIDTGVYALTGNDVGLARGLLLTADAGSYTLTGNDVGFARTYALAADAGAYTLTGVSVTLTYSGAGGPTVQAGISPYRRDHFGTAGGRPAQLSSGRRPRQ